MTEERKMSKKKTSHSINKKHKRFYVMFNHESGDYEIKSIDETKDPQTILKIMVDDMYLFTGSYAECHAFKKGYRLGYLTFKQYYKQNVDRILKTISDKIFDKDITMNDME